MGILSTLFIAVGLIGFATGQQIEPRPSQNAERLERRVAELERQIAALLDELHELRRDVGPMRRLSIIPVKNIDPVECATLMKELWRRRPDVVIHAIPKMKAIAVQADQKTTSESRRLVAVLDIAPETTVPEIKVIIGRSDPRVFDQALRAIKKAQEDYEKTELAKRQGRWTLIVWQEEGLHAQSEEVKKWKMTVKGDEWHLTREDKEVSRGTFRLDFSQDPHHEDSMSKHAAVATYGIFAIEDNRLTSCYATDPKHRPRTFEAGPGRTFMVWEREKQ